ncbi:hypothetical protein ACLOJK_030079 [Asimina triloba]
MLSRRSLLGERKRGEEQNLTSKKHFEEEREKGVFSLELREQAGKMRARELERVKCVANKTPKPAHSSKPDPCRRVVIINKTLTQ